jgi:hypothetical protein
MSIPQELKQFRQWMTWNLVDGRKIPNGKSNDPSTWTDFNDVAIYDRKAFVFSAEDPFTGIDLDSCRDPSSGEIKLWAMAIIKTVNSYCEVSPSGTGVKIILKARKPEGSRCTYDMVSEVGTDPNKAAQCEIYDNRRFWCMTGQVVLGFEEIREAQAELYEIIQFLTSIQPQKQSQPQQQQAPKPTSLSYRNVDALHKRAQAYVDKADLPMPGQRNNAAFRLAGNIAAIDQDGQRLTRDEVMELMRQWNSRLADPLPAVELESATVSAMTNGKQRSPKESQQMIAPVQTSYQQTEQSNETTTWQELSYRTYTATELDDANCRIDYLVNGVLVENQPTMLVAPQKSMKTTMSIDLCLSIATETPFLDHFSTTFGRSLLMTGESGLGTVQETARRIASNKGFELRDIGAKFIVSDEIPLLYSEVHLIALRRLLENVKPTILVADPVYLMVKGDNAGNLFLMGEQIRPAAELCQDLGITFVLVHHATRSSENVKGYQPLSLGDIAWSGFSEFARQWMFLNRREPYQLGTGDHKLWFSYGGSAGHSGCWAVDVNEGSNDASQGRYYRVSVEEQGEAIEKSIEEQQAAKEAKRKAAEEVKIREYAKQLFDAIPFGETVTKSQLRDFAGLSGDRASKGMSLLLRKEAVELTTKKIYGRDYDAYKRTDKGFSL